MISAQSTVLPRYLGQHGVNYHEDVCAVPARLYDAVARLRAEKFQPYVKPVDRVLEYGVGLGYNLSALRCAEKVGFDVGEHLAAPLRERGMPFSTSTAMYPDGYFDAVICHHVIEHVSDPWRVLGEIRRLVRRGGTLVLNVPYEKERRYRTYHSDDRNGHLYSWNVQTLGALVCAAGWSVESLKLPLFGYDRFAAVVADRLGLGDRAYRLIRRGLLILRPGYEIQAVLKNTA